MKLSWNHHKLFNCHQLWYLSGKGGKERNAFACLPIAGLSWRTPRAVSLWRSGLTRCAMEPLSCRIEVWAESGGTHEAINQWSWTKTGMVSLCELFFEKQIWWNYEIIWNPLNGPLLFFSEMRRPINKQLSHGVGFFILLGAPSCSTDVLDLARCPNLVLHLHQLLGDLGAPGCWPTQREVVWHQGSVLSKMSCKHML